MKTAILGSRGLVGEAFSRKCSHTVLSLSRNDLDLLDTLRLADLLASHQIDTVINCAAKVGGIELNRSVPYDMFVTNLLISSSVLNASIFAGVANLVQFCSNCSYPVNAQQPYKETTLLDGAPHQMNKGYTESKRAALHAGQCAEDQELIKVYHPIPCSLFGFNDNYNVSNSHSVASVIRKVHSAVLSNSDQIEFWGSGKPFREFMFADHLVGAIDFLLNKGLSYNPLNIGPVVDIPIKDIVEYICTQSKFQGNILLDHSKPDGALHKLLDSSLLYSHGWLPPINYLASSSETYNFYASNQVTLRL